MIRHRVVFLLLIHEGDFWNSILLPVFSCSANICTRKTYLYVLITNNWNLTMEIKTENNMERHGERCSRLWIFACTACFCHDIGCIHSRNMTNVCPYKRQQCYFISFIYHRLRRLPKPVIANESTLRSSLHCRRLLHFCMIIGDIILARPILLPFTKSQKVHPFLVHIISCQ